MSMTLNNVVGINQYLYVQELVKIHYCYYDGAQRSIYNIMLTCAKFDDWSLVHLFQWQSLA